MVAPADETQAITDLRPDVLGHRRRLACLLPIRARDHIGRDEMIKGDVFGAALCRAEAARRQDPRHAGERRNVLGVIPGVESGLDRGRRRHRDEQEPAAALRCELVGGEDLLAFEAQQALAARGDALRPGRQILAANFAISDALKHRQAIEIVDRDRVLGLEHRYARRSKLDPEPALTAQKPGHAFPLGNVLEIVPIVELVLGDIRKVHRRDQLTFCHGGFLRLCEPRCYAESAFSARGQGAMPLSASSRRAFSFLSRSKPIACNTCGALVNCILAYSMTSTRFPQGSRKSRKGPGKSRPPAASTRMRTLDRSSTTRPKCRRWSSWRVLVSIRLINWSPSSMKALPGRFPLSAKSKILP